MKEFKVGEGIVLDIVVTKTVTCAGCFLMVREVVKFGENTHAQGNNAQTIKM